MKRWIIFVVVILTTALLGGLIWNYYQVSLTRKQPGPAEAVVFVVNEGEGVASIAGRLAEERLIRSAWLLKVYLRLNRLDKSLQAGVFKVPQNISLIEVINLLQHGQADLKLTFIEGWRREEMAKYLKSKVNPSTGSGLTLSEVERVKNQKSKVDFGEDFLRETEGMEGYLFPDTYYMPAWFTARQLVEMMRVNFEKKLQSLLDEPTALGEKQTTMTLEERVILASIVEREVKFPEDRPLVAGILIKRGQNNWPLEADATLQYALANLKFNPPSGGESLKLADIDFWPKQITAKDLELDSSYNTRQYRGLPPTPISNPGLAALRAVFFPQESPYWFYLSDKEGRMHYARTIEEHSRNIVRYLNE